MTIAQMILAGRGLIDPTIAIGGLAFSDTDTRTYSGNGSYVTMSDDTYILPNNWKTKDWTYKAQITSTASYVCVGYTVQLYINDVLTNTWSTDASNSGWFRYNSGTRTHTSVKTLQAGDKVRAVVRLAGRNVGGTTPSTTNYHELKRTT